MVHYTPHVLVIDDDQDIRTLLGKYLEGAGYRVTLAEDGSELADLIKQCHFDLIILDIMLPGEDGYALCRTVRQSSNVPIIMLTAMGEADYERIVGLETGADDYMAKPFNPRELIARIKAVLRRSQSMQSGPSHSEGDVSHPSNPTVTTEAVNPSQTITYCFAGWSLHPAQRRLISPDHLDVSLTSGEFDLLLVFVEHPHTVLSRDQLLNLTKHRDAGPFDRSIDIQISRLRRRIEKTPKTPTLIKTVRGGGYLFATKVEKNTC